MSLLLLLEMKVRVDVGSGASVDRQSENIKEYTSASSYPPLPVFGNSGIPLKSRALPRSFGETKAIARPQPSLVPLRGLQRTQLGHRPGPCRSHAVPHVPCGHTGRLTQPCSSHTGVLEQASRNGFG